MRDPRVEKLVKKIFDEYDLRGELKELLRPCCVWDERKGEFVPLDPYYGIFQRIPFPEDE